MNPAQPTKWQTPVVPKYITERMRQRCTDCGIRLDSSARARTSPADTMLRCPICAEHYKLRTKYADLVDKRRSVALRRAAHADRRNARHCMGCHHIRHRKAFNKGAFSDPYAQCSLCRDKIAGHARSEAARHAILLVLEEQYRAGELPGDVS